ncbi:MAG: site-specific integrase [Bacteroidales bacterium]|nr:site-specific integrase [Bacteroidales bacterium]
MKQKSEFTILERAIQTVDGFSRVFNTLQQQMILRGQSPSTLNNYIRQVASISLHFGQLPELISEEEINEYLTALAQRPDSPSRSQFKHAVYGLRYYFRHVGLSARAVELPSLKKELKLPVILNRSELRELFKAPRLLKHRIILTLVYSAGLRSHETINLKISDIDFERKTIHIRQSKYKKDRVVPLSDYMAKGLRQYLLVEHPQVWLFNGKDPDGSYSSKGLGWVFSEALKKTSIQKDVSIHSLRHSYATHLLEEGLNIVTIKELLGHAHIATTMIYLHVAQCPLMPVHSPLDTLYAQKSWNAPDMK